MLKHCSWCIKDTEVEIMQYGGKIPIVCSECGSNLGYITWQDLNKIIKELHFYKKLYLTNQK